MKWRTILLASFLIAVGVGMGLVISAGGPFGDTSIAPAGVMAQSASESTGPAMTDEQRTGINLAQSLSNAFAFAAERATPAVVTILSEQTIKTQGAPQWLPDFFPHDWMPQPRGEGRSFRREGLGSGVIVRSDGYILTNNHVVEKADRLTVVLEDDEQVPAELVGRDPRTDLAVIRVDRDDLPTIQFGDSDVVRVGEWVLAIGNPFGQRLRHTVTAGIVSALGRTIGIVGANDDYRGFENFIQTDAAINPGNSGGALVNLRGELVGVNTAISSTTGANMGVGFAIPVNMARSIMDQLIEHGRVIRGYLGVRIQNIDQEVQESLGLPDRRGALVGDVTDDGPAAESDLREGDVIRSINGESIANVDELRYRIASTPPGEQIRLGVWRAGETLTLRVTLRELPARFATAVQGESGGESADLASRLGISVRNISPRIRGSLELPEDIEGVLVHTVDRGSQAEERGLRPGDVIQEVNLQPVRNVAEFQDILAGLPGGDSVLLFVRRGDGTLFIGLRMLGGDEE